MEQIAQAIASINEAGNQSVGGTRQVEQEVKHLQDLALQLKQTRAGRGRRSSAGAPMIDDDEEFLRDLMETFREDAEERIRLLSQAVVELETDGGDR